MVESLLKELDLLVLRCWYSGSELSFASHGGSNMFLIDQGNPSLQSDAEKQTWYICTWWSNRYKLSMRPNEFKEHMDHLSENYDESAAVGAYEA